MSVQRIVSFILIVFLLTSLAFGGNNKRFKPDFLPVSVWYSGGKVRAPMLSSIDANSKEEWRRDLQQIKSLGFNTVRTWVEWAHGEPRPGEYQFENLQLLCELAQEVGLQVFIQMYVDSAPDWVGKKFPDALFEAQSGEKILSQSAPGFCSDHLGVRQAVLNFYTETAKVATQYSNVYGWDLWSEPHIVNWAYINYVPNVQFCFCPHTQARFREWLKEKYKTLTALNQAWYRNFEYWDDVTPPRFGTILSYTDFIDWKNFIYDRLAGDLRLRYEAIRRADPVHVITSHAAVPSIFYTPYNGYGATDDFLMAEQIDFYGTSLYPKHNHPDRHWERWKFLVAVDFSRSANLKNGGFYVGELQAGKGTIGLNIGNPITPEDHRLWMWSVIAKGARAIHIYAYYPMSSGYESGGYGLINLDGTITERAKYAGQIARIIDDHNELFLNSSPMKSEIAIVYNPLAQMVGGEQHSSSGDKHQLSLFSYYRFFMENNIPVDFLHRRDLESGAVSQYKLIIVPYPLMFSQKAAEGLKAFVEQGGFVLAEARLAWNDERGFAAPQIPGMGLSEVFGITESNIRMSETVHLTICDKTHPSLVHLKLGDRLKGAYFAESLNPLAHSSAQVLAKLDNEIPSLVANRFGKGETLFIGTFLGMANHPVADKKNNQFLAGLLRWADIKRPFTFFQNPVTEPPIEVYLSTYPAGYLLFVFNQSEQTVRVTIDLRVDQAAEFEITEIVHQKSSRLSSTHQTLKIQTTMSRKEVAVWRVQSLSENF